MARRRHQRLREAHLHRLQSAKRPNISHLLPNAPAGDRLLQDPPAIDPPYLTYSSRPRLLLPPATSAPRCILPAPRNRKREALAFDRRAESCPSPRQIFSFGAAHPLHQLHAPSQRIHRLPTIAQSLAHHHTTPRRRANTHIPFIHSLTLPPPPTTAPPRPRANTMGSYTFRWYVMPFSKFHPPARKGKDASSAMEQRRARVRAGLKLAAVELSPSRLLGRAVLRYSHPRTRKSSHTSNTPRDLLTDCCCLHIGIILPKKYTLPAPLTAGPRVLSLTKTAHPSQRPSTSPPSTARSNTRCVAQDLPAAELPVNRHDRAHLFGYHQTFPLTPARSSSQTEIGNTITLPKPKQTTKET